MWSRWQLWGVVALAFILGILGVRAKWVSDGEAKLRAKMEAQRLKSLERARDIENEVEALDRDTLRNRARQWVRNR